MHFGQDVAFLGAGPGRLAGRLEGLVSQLGRAPHVGQLSLALDQPEAADQVGGVGPGTIALERLAQTLPAAPGQAVGFELDA